MLAEIYIYLSIYVQNIVYIARYSTEKNTESENMIV